MAKKIVKKSAKKNVSKKTAKNDLIKFDIDKVCSMFIEGAKWKDVADHFGLAVSTLHNELSKNPEFFARAKQARVISGDAYAEMAERVLIDAPSNGIEIQRARELAQHYRWMAGKRNPKQYGERLDVTTDGEKVNAPVFMVNAVVHQHLAQLGEPVKILPESTESTDITEDQA